jgi:phospholipase C
MNARFGRLAVVVVICGVVACGTTAALGAADPTTATPPPVTTTPFGPADTMIQHVVVIMQENHSYNNVLGKLCVDNNAAPVRDACDGTLTGQLYGGTPIALRQAPDVVPSIPHTVGTQLTAVDDGKMDGFSRINSCSATRNYACLSYYDESSIPNLAALADRFVISDHSFSPANAPSWGGHFAMVSPSNGWVRGWAPTFGFDGFEGANPTHLVGDPPQGQGWGCDSNLRSLWKATPSARPRPEPSCIPSADGSGAFMSTPVQHVPTIMDSLDTAGLSWKIYGALPGDGGYVWNICPTFADCLKRENTAVAPRTTFATDAAAGNLPAVSFVEPNEGVSQHNSDSMLAGDNWIGKNVSAVENGPDWSSTAIFITYDDCGCFYDPLSPDTPVTGLGIRVPMVIISPWAKPGFTDSNPTSSTSGILSFIEHNFGLTPIIPASVPYSEYNYYDYSESFDFTQTPVAPSAMVQHALPPSSLHLHTSDAGDPS